MYFFNDTICLIIFLDSLQNDFFKKTEIPELIGVFMQKNAVSIKPQCFLGGQPTVDHRVEHDDTRRDHGPTIIPYLDQCG